MAVTGALEHRSIRGGRSCYRVVAPSIRDSRSHVAAVIISLHVLGQVAFGFELSIPQILISVATCGLIELCWVFVRDRVVAWPASALLTGNGVAFILRVDGTRHGDWWSVRGLHLFAATAALSLLSKYVIRWRGEQVFNPSNLGLLVCFVLVGTRIVNPLDFWWAPLGLPLVLAYAVIIVGGVAIGRRLGLVTMSLAFWVTFAAGMGILAGSGHCIRARWSLTPVCGTSLWTNVALSPEVLVFLFFMVTDPSASPRNSRRRVVFGVGVAVLAALLMAPQQTEFGSKVALIGSLVVACVLRFVMRVLLADPARLRWARRGPVIAVGGFAATVVLVFVLNAAGRQTTLTARVAETSQSRSAPPLVEVPFVVPKVRLSSSVSSIFTEIDQATADEIGRDVVENLVVERDAQESGRPDETDWSSTAARRGVLSDRAAADPRISGLMLVVQRNAAQPQAPPRLAIKVDGIPDETIPVQFNGRRYLNDV